MKKKKLTTASGRPISEFENSMTVGNRGPVLLQDYLLHEGHSMFLEETQKFNTELIKFALK